VVAGLAAVLQERTHLPLKKRGKVGTTHVVLTKQVLMERLCALVPRSRRHLVTDTRLRSYRYSV